MVGVESAEHPFGDLFRCGACQVEQAIYWEHGERLVSMTDEPEE